MWFLAPDKLKGSEMRPTEASAVGRGSARGGGGFYSVYIKVGSIGFEDQGLDLRLERHIQSDFLSPVSV